MSTNFYYKVNKGPFASLMPLHIGLRAGGWVFQFQAFNIPAQTHEFWAGYSRQLGISLELPNLCIASKANWQTFMAENEGQVFDEFNKEWSTKEFWQMIERLSPQNPELRNAFALRNQYENGPSNPDEEEWRDIEGFPVSLQNFS